MKSQNKIASKQNYLLSKTNLAILAGYLLLTSFVVSCQTGPKIIDSYENVQSGTWRGTVYMKDKVKDKAHTLKFKTTAEEFSNLRLDVTSSLAGHIASVSVRGNNLSYIVPSERKFFSGEISSEAMKKVLPFEVDPKILFNVFWDKPLEGRDWVCKVSDRKKRHCKSKSLGTVVKWALSPKYGKLVAIGHKKGLLKFKIKKFTANLDKAQKSRFEIKNPGW